MLRPMLLSAIRSTARFLAINRYLILICLVSACLTIPVVCNRMRAASEARMQANEKPTDWRPEIRPPVKERRVPGAEGALYVVYP